MSSEASTEIAKRYLAQCRISSDINEHLPTLKDLAAQCATAVEFGVRGIISTYALLTGLIESSGSQLTCVDIDEIDMEEVKGLASAAGVELTFLQHDSATVTIPQTDLLWIDTFHVYGHLKRELAAHHSKVNKYIAMHDTEIDGIYGEAIRCSLDCEGMAAKFGYTIEEVRLGLKHAIDEFLAEHGDEWCLHAHHPNCNGLTILRRK
jgi:hypothetical protein